MTHWHWVVCTPKLRENEGRVCTTQFSEGQATSQYPSLAKSGTYRGKNIERKQSKVPTQRILSQKRICTFETKISQNHPVQASEYDLRDTNFCAFKNETLKQIYRDFFKGLLAPLRAKGSSCIINFTFLPSQLLPELSLLR